MKGLVFVLALLMLMFASIGFCGEQAAQKSAVQKSAACASAIQRATLREAWRNRPGLFGWRNRIRACN